MPNIMKERKGMRGYIFIIGILAIILLSLDSLEFLLSADPPDGDG